MESTKSPEDRKDVSPSQENIENPQLLKHEVESLEDFEDLIKDEPSMIDMTSQFLKKETTPIVDRNFIENDSDFDDPETKKKKESDLPSDPVKKGSLIALDNFDNVSDFDQQFSMSPSAASLEGENEDDVLKDLTMAEVEIKTNTSSKEGIDSFENEQKSENQPIMTVLEGNKLVDVLNDDLSTESEDISFIPMKGESSPVFRTDFHTDKDILKKALTECKSNEATDIPTSSQPISKYRSEQTVREQEPETLQGDGLHVRETEGNDGSECEDFIPEPIPKDYPEIGVLEGKQLWAAIGIDNWFHPILLHPKIESLVYWRDPKKSGIVFGSILIILLSLTSFSLISVLAHASLIVLAGALAFRIYDAIVHVVQKTPDRHPFKIYSEMVLFHPIVSAVFLTIKEYLEFDLTVNPERARQIADVVVSHVNKSLTKFRRLFLVEDLLDSIKFGIILWCLTFVGAWFNGLSLLIICFVGLFTLPKVYENNKTQVDANIDIVKSKINEISEKLRVILPLGKKTEEVKDKGE